MKLYIKNMVCSRCKMMVKTELEKAGLQPVTIDLGEVEVKEVPTPSQLKQLESSLNELGFELIDDQKSRLIEQIKTLIIEQVHYAKGQSLLNFRPCLLQNLIMTMVI